MRLVYPGVATFFVLPQLTRADSGQISLALGDQARPAAKSHLGLCCAHS